MATVQMKRTNKPATPPITQPTPPPSDPFLDELNGIDDDEEGWETVKDPKVAAQLKRLDENKKIEELERKKQKGIPTDDEDPLDGMQTISKSAIDQAAIQLRQARQLPPVPGKQLSLEEMNQWLALLDNEQKRDRVIIYMYRLKPVVNRQITDPDAASNIDVLEAKPITEKYIIDNHGGGMYKWIVNDLERFAESKTSKGNTLFTATHTIDHTVHIPLINWNELDISNNKNRGFITWAQGKGLLDNQGRPKEIVMAPQNQQNDAALSDKAANRQQQQPKESMDVTMTKAIDIVSEASKTQMAMIRDNYKKDDNAPKEMMQMFTQLLVALKPPAPEIGMKEMLLMMQENTKQQMAMMQMMMEKNNPTSSKIGDLKDLIEIAKALGSNGPAPSLTDRLIDTVSTNAGPLLGLVTTMLQKGQAGQPPTTQIPMMLDQNGNAIAAPITQPVANPTIQPTTQQLQQMSQEEQMNIFKMQITSAIKNQHMIIANAITTDTPGDVFAESLITFQGRAVYDAIRGLGPDTLLGIFKSIPELWNAISVSKTEMDVKKFVDDFCNLDQILKDLQEEQDKGQVIPMPTPTEKGVA